MQKTCGRLADTEHVLNKLGGLHTCTRMRIARVLGGRAVLALPRDRKLSIVVMLCKAGGGVWPICDVKS